MTARTTSTSFGDPKINLDASGLDTCKYCNPFFCWIIFNLMTGKDVRCTTALVPYNWSDTDHFGLDDLFTMKMPNPLGGPGHPEYYKTETAFMALSRRINFLTRNLVHALVHLLVDIFQF